MGGVLSSGRSPVWWEESRLVGGTPSSGHSLELQLRLRWGSPGPCICYDLWDSVTLVYWWPLCLFPQPVGPWHSLMCREYLRMLSSL